MNVSIRKDRTTGRLVLFFYNSSRLGGRVWLECYDRIGQHSEACLEYMHRCAPVDPESPEAQKLRDEWASIPGGDGQPVRIVRRLVKP